MDSLMEQLHDIEGIDPVSWWPLAPGWWILLFIICLFVGIGIYFVFRRIAYKRSWQSDTLRQLQLLEHRLTKESAKEIASTLSEFMRRIAIARFPRKECAGLIGNDWLKWLAEHDPKHFAWEQKGKILLDAPYAPESHTLALQEVREILHAIKKWVF